MNTHNVCMGRVTTVTRAVITRPDDKSWPHDVTVALPYCETCRTVVSYTDVLYVPERSA